MEITSRNNKAIKLYYRTLEEYRKQGAEHEGAVRAAFSNLLEAHARPRNWTLVGEYTLSNRRRIDGALFDEYKIARGYWEAKDSKDDLDSEISRKITYGYPLENTIFEDTRRGVLYQDNHIAFDADLSNQDQLAALLSRFFNYSKQQIENFHHAVSAFRERIPDLAQSMMRLITENYASNKRFFNAFGKFHELCREALNPNISTEAIEEMLVQHLLTERLFRTVFDNPDFTRRNIIAAEIEAVIDALTSRAFSRSSFLQPLDYFYDTIEQTAHTIDDFSEKQAFLNTVYERFFQGFSQKQADTHGIVYTPQEIVDFMCASVQVVLERDFNASLAAPGVVVLDPCVGTGNFIVNLLRRMHTLSPRSFRQKYEHDLFCNEVMLLPYYIAALNIEHASYELSGEYAPFEGICFVDTLDLARDRQMQMFVEENSKRVERQQHAEITVIIGNPPYNVGQVNENDNNKNRRYDTIDRRVRETYAKDSQASNKNALSDPYVKFFRWATDRLQERNGIVCFVSNNSFVDQIAFDGMRKHMLDDFTHIYHIDLHGNVRQNPKLSGTTHNVFGIQVGVGITIAMRSTHHTGHTLCYYRVPEEWHKTEKLAFLAECGSIDGVAWERLQPDAKHTWLTQGLHADFATFLPMGTKETKTVKSYDVQAIFKIYSRGAETTRDSWMYDFNTDKLSQKAQSMIDTYNGELLRWIRAGKPKDIDNFVNTDATKIKWSSRLKECFAREVEVTFDEKCIRNALYRPFTRQCLYFDNVMTHRQGMLPYIFPTLSSEAENQVIWLKVGSEVPMFALVTNIIPDLMPQGGSQCFPYYTYDEDGSNRRENITDWALHQFRARYGEQVSKWDIFHYVYAVLHHPTYRERYAENLKRELPRIPFVPGGSETFSAMVAIGRTLADLHLHYERVQEYPALRDKVTRTPMSWKVNKMKLSKDKGDIIVNSTLTLQGVPPECFDYRLGNRSALEWIIDQYQVKQDRRSGIVSDPNRDEPGPDGEEYIVRLIGRVITVSIETVRLVEQLQTHTLVTEE